MSPKPPILLLKTKSSPHDGYDDFFSQDYTPTFIPVLEHRFHSENLTHVRSLFASGAFNNTPKTLKKYGGMIFTSQRAVEAFTKKIEEEGRTSAKPNNTTPTPFLTKHTVPPTSQSIPLYTVGPATARALTTLRNKYLPTATIHGEDAGTGEKLAHLILDHYNAMYAAQAETPALLFLVGEQRRDIIPKTLMAESLAPAARIAVDEVVVYETGEMESFERDFERAVRGLDGVEKAWVVVFSPSGCEAMLRVLGLGPFRRSATGGEESLSDRKIFIATIGPTTRDHLRDRFGVEADVCAEKPSPEGVGEGIRRFMALQGE